MTDSANFRINKPLGIMATRGLDDFLRKIDEKLVSDRQIKAKELKGKIPDSELELFSRDSFIIPHKIETFGDGHLKNIVNKSVNGMEIYIVADPTRRVKYDIRDTTQETSPNDIFVETLSLLNATKRHDVNIHIITPYAFSSRQDNPKDRESHDLRWMAEAFVNAGAKTIISVDAHNPSTLKGVLGQDTYDNLHTSYPLIKALIQSEQELDSNFDIDEFLENLEVVSPDRGAIARNDYLSKLLTGKKSCNRGMDKTRDHEIIVDGKNLIVSHEYYGGPVKKYVLIGDDIVGSGGTCVSSARLMKQHGAKRVYFVTTHPQFLKGPGVIDEVNDVCEGGEPLIRRIIGTNASYIAPNVLEKPWFYEADISSFLSVFINEHHTYGSVSRFLDDTKKINEFLEKIRKNK